MHVKICTMVKSTVISLKSDKDIYEKQCLALLDTNSQLFKNSATKEERNNRGINAN